MADFDLKLGWSCLASLKLRVKAVQEQREDYNFQQLFKMFDGNQDTYGYRNQLIFTELISPYKGWFDGHDNVTFEAEVQAEQPCHIANYAEFLNEQRTRLTVQKPSATIDFAVNKTILARESENFFTPFFFGADYTEFQQQQFKLNIDEEADFVHFERLLMMIPLTADCEQLDDEIIEQILKRADEYQLLNFKYRLAIAYNLPVLKMHVLKSLCRDDFDIYAFESNIHECFKLESNDLELLLVHYRELCDSDEFDE